ncbi:BZ3500_MvSof-1268-A1-R1_Chr1-1g01095 [Microbotryum saponariae]|uniref:chitin synthase n=1 Tax=Microbotryum saponariae TaxID=289078 RepID=A0A2X0MGS7_9BASI|nr:BZ3500_MvSof-1268-A1-R1_Chr1-1g01095 [Microbotryum saponariae]SCZ93380.1 BZ3501_MvSof-1269-A2-R1_Chr1-1g00692 [Microbotryum saponariae]
MSYNPRFLTNPTYMRQSSFDDHSSASSPSSSRHASPLVPPPLAPPPSEASHAQPNRGGRGAPSQWGAARDDGDWGDERMRRRQTVRGVIPGTVREAGIDPRASFVPNRTMMRGKTLTRPERFVAPAPLINPNPTNTGGKVQTALIDGVPTLKTEEAWYSPWRLFVEISTIWAPRWLLSACGLTDRAKQRAWKEKCALCEISLLMMGAIGFLTLGLTRTLCPSNAVSQFQRLGEAPGSVGIAGRSYKVSGTAPATISTAANTLGGSDVTDLFDRSAIRIPACNGLTAAYATTNLCSSSASNTSCTLGAFTEALATELGLTKTDLFVGYDWNQLEKLENYLVLDGSVLNLNPYMLAHPNPIANDTVDTAIRFVLKKMNGSGGKDATRIFYNLNELRKSSKCLQERYYAGHIDKVTPGCFVSDLVLYTSLCLIMTIILTRFLMACIFHWWLSAKLVRPPKNLKRHAISPAVMPEGANIDIDNKTGAAPWTQTEMQRRETQRLKKRDRSGARGGRSAGDSSSEKDNPFLEKPVPTSGRGRTASLNSTSRKITKAAPAVRADGMINLASIGAELFVACLVTCYSEGAAGIKSTLDSIAGTTYSDARKLLFVVCDGMITGHGEKQSTPDICVGLLEADPRFGEPQAMSYIAIGDGSKAHNHALVYAGHYTSVRGHRTPTIIVVKCGTPDEANDKKPGNRGKRDSQMVLMNFFSRVTYNDRMTPLDFDLFRKVQSLMGVTPDFFETVLMVDADTKVYPDSLSMLVRTMQNDSMIMGVCGETRVANKRQSWVTMIQVFEYYISHHLSKSFESVFGGVTCLPGCFSMYRLKARKEDEGDWFPVLVQPQIVSQYSQSVVTTLHQKNLLLLGEDRFLTTLLLRTFPNRKMMFCPQARCRTVAPDTFSVLLSQRRRWINSTIHNLMELVRVPNLCGTFCFSMQFMVLVDLIGTVVLPIAICLTYTLIITYIFHPPSSFSDAIPLLLLGAVLGLPAVLILISTFKVVYVGWMLLYLVALPIWNLVLPVYAFSKFDDFSWGETRKVIGEIKGDDGHGVGGVAAKVPMRRWEDWEKTRLRKKKRDERRRREFERQFDSRLTHGSSNSLYDDSNAPSETASSYGGDEDRWGMDIGGYLEDGPTALPPPVGLFSIDAESEEGETSTLDARELELVLDQGWGDEEAQRGYASSQSHGYASPPVSGGGRRGSPPAPPRLYSLSDGPSSGQAWTNSSFEPLKSASPTSIHGPLDDGNYVSYGTAHAPTLYSDPDPSKGNTALSSSVDRSTGHAKRRSLGSSSQPASPEATRQDASDTSPPHHGYGRRIA